MKHLSLAAKYRPQNFSEVVGQELAVQALSRAAAEDRVAPAYLLSGTRGVGKTTIARIFAKALNCANGPSGEPCNNCRQCQQITAGNHVDVNEIDGASNTGVDDVRALRENIGFMPMEGRYKIFIVDEAHMLSKSAFNALLKTLEEPPGHTVFIFATTEAHRFPATIISRCQHYVFRHLPERGIFGHLCDILQKEGIEYEEEAVGLIARRAAGSVRDSLSLLDQVLSLCAGRLDDKTTRESLGLAGREFFDQLFACLPVSDCGRIVSLARELLQSGVDIGFFTRELGANLRNLFLLSQSGEGILPALDLTPDEGAFLKKHVSAFSPAHLHAAWQMTLESQRRITQNPDPGSAMELLLINLALLPKLLPVGKVPDSMTHADLGKQADSPATQSPEAAHEEAAAQTPQPTPAMAEKKSEISAGSACSWEDFCKFCADLQANNQEAVPKDILHQVKVRWQPDCLSITVPTATLGQRLEKKKPLLVANLKAFCKGEAPAVDIIKPQPVRSRKDMLEECKTAPEVQLLAKMLDATVSECSINNNESR